MVIASLFMKDVVCGWVNYDKCRLTLLSVSNFIVLSTYLRLSIVYGCYTVVVLSDCVKHR